LRKRIGIDCLFAVPGKTWGTWVFAKNLLEEITALDSENTYVIFLTPTAAANFPLGRPNVVVVKCRLAGLSIGARLAHQNLLLPLLAKFHRLALLHSLGNYGPVLPLVRSVVTVHDMLPFFSARQRQDSTPSFRAGALDLVMRRSLSRAHAITTVSEFTRQQLILRYPFTSTKIRVVYGGYPPHKWTLPHDVQGVFRKYGIRAPFLLSVRLWPPHKNIERLIQAFARLKIESGIPHQLVLVGTAEPNHQSLLNLVAAAGLKTEVVFTGTVSDAELAGLYAAADLFVCPSLMEGFGLPLLEAMANQTPVVCSNSGPLPEIAGDAALMFDPLSIEDMARAIGKVLGDPALRLRLVDRGLKRLEQFSFRRAAEQMLQLYEEVIRPGRRNSA